MKILTVLVLAIILLLALAAPALAVRGVAPGETVALEKLMTRPQFIGTELPTSFSYWVPINAVQLNPQPEVPSSLFPVPPSPVWPH